MSGKHRISKKYFDSIHKFDFVLWIGLILTNVSVYSEEKEPTYSVETSTEIVSDFIWRGSSFAGEAKQRRNGDSYQSFTYAPAFQPTIDIFNSSRNFQFQLFGNFQLSERQDRDSDKRIFQSSPGGVGPSYLGESSSYYDPYNQDPCVQNVTNTLTQGAMDNSPCFGTTKGDIGSKREPNGMRRVDGVFFSLAYHFEKGKWGDFSAGIWFYNTFNKSPAILQNPGTQKPNPYVSGGPANTYNSNNPDALTRLSWHEYFFVWKFPILKVISPTASVFTQYSTENGGLLAGKNYISLAFSHTFRENEFFRIQPNVNIGYAYTNNTVDNRNGIQDITSNLTFFLGDGFFRLAHIFRPNLYLFDTNNYFGFPGGDPDRASWNRSAEDGRVPDPSKMYGYKSNYILQAIDNLDFGSGIFKEYTKTVLREKYILQRIPAHLFYVSIGYSKSF